MSKVDLPKSVKKFIREEKARIRRNILDTQKQQELINAVYAKFVPQLAEIKEEVKTSLSAQPPKAEAKKVEVKKEKAKPKKVKSGTK